MNIGKKLLSRLTVRRKDNKGSSIVTVVVVMALLMIMISIVLSTTLMNVYMKANDRETTTNFYSAEGALEEIRMGLALEVSTAMAKAYNQVLAEYDNNSAAQKNIKFKYYFSQAIEKSASGLIVAAEGDSVRKYSTAHLAKYLRKTAPAPDSSIGATIVTPENKAIAILNGEDGVTLKNVEVSYLDKDGYISDIKTDILLAYPKMSFIAPSITPDLASFCIIAGSDPTASDAKLADSFVYNAGSSSIEGNAYLGEGNAKISSFPTFVKTTIDPNVKKYKLIVSGDANIENGATVTVSDYDVWAKSLNLTSATLNETNDNCTTNLSNDLVLATNGWSGSTATLKGQYFGFGVDDGTGALASDSSSIIVNGVKSNLDMSALTKLIVGGLAYVDKDTYDAEKNDFSGADVMTGETVSIKPNQRAYIIPLELVGIDYNNGGFNPMPNDRYDKLVEEVKDDTGYFEDYVKASMLVNFNKEFEVGKLDDTIATKENIEEIIKEINGTDSAEGGVFYIPEGKDVVMAKSLSEIGVSAYKTYNIVNALSSAHNMTYLFMDFDSTKKANDYYKIYSALSVQNERLNGNLKNLYAGTAVGIKMPGQAITDAASATDISDISYYFKGSLIDYDATNGSKVYNPIKYADGSLIGETGLKETAEGSALAQLYSKRSSYNGLTHKLVEDVLTPEELSRNVYENLVDALAMNGEGIDEDRYPEMKIIPGGEKSFTASDGSVCWIVRNTGSIKLSSYINKAAENACDATGKELDTQPTKKFALLISTGDVEIDCSYDGLVFAAGKITVTGNNLAIKCDVERVNNALKAFNKDKVRPGHYLMDYESYVDDDSNDDSDAIKELEYVKYANWQKK